MKMLSVLLMAVFACLNGYAQENKPSIAERKEQQTASLKNKQLVIDNETFDYRIFRHYTEQQLQQMPAAKRHQVYYLYTGSYKVLNAGNCSTFKITDIDVAALSTLRKENESVVVQVGKDCKVSVELLPNKIVREKLEELKNAN
jgi:hypothetical protein